MKARLWIAASAAVIAAACAQMPAGDVDQVRYGKVTKTEVVSGDGRGTMRIIVAMPDGSTVESVQERDSSIMVQDVVRVYGSGSKVRVGKI